MTKEKALAILKQPDRIGCTLIKATDEESCKFNQESIEALNMAINALETVEEFEKAQIITGGRLNGRTYAYKCGLEDGKRKALEEINEEQTRVIDSSEIDIQKFTEAMKRQPLQVVNHLSEQVIQPCEDCVSRQAVIDLAETIRTDDNSGNEILEVIEVEDVKALPPVTPAHCIATIRFSKEDLREICNERIEIECTHGTCKDCKHREGIDLDDCFCAKHGNSARDDFYCADFEK